MANLAKQVRAERAAGERGLVLNPPVDTRLRLDSIHTSGLHFSSLFYGFLRLNFFTDLPKTVEILQNLCYNDNVITKQTYEVNL